MRSVFVISIALSGLLLAGCENDAASFQDAGEQGQSLTLIREQRRFWDSNADVALVVARQPDCQRRHALKATPPADARVELFRDGARRYLLKQDGAWFLADAGTCQLSSTPAPAAAVQPESLGAFEREDGRLRFKPLASQTR